MVIVGGGFAGLQAAKSLRRAPVEVTLIDRTNHHLFQPLLYQVATGGLSPANIAAPLRAILHRQKNVCVLQGEVSDFSLADRYVNFDEQRIDYDSLIVAAGATHSYFGHDEWAEVAPGLKSINDATEIRGRILSAFECAEKLTDEATRQRLMTFVIVGGGPTGVELAGAVAELSRFTLADDFRQIDTSKSRIILVDAGERVLSNYDLSLSAKAQHYLNKLGVEVRTSELVTAISPTQVTLSAHDQHCVIETETVLWAAGVAASPLARKLADACGAKIDRAGRVPVNKNLTLDNYPNVFVLGDMASCPGTDGKPLPGLAPVAMQQGEHTARTIRDRLRSKPTREFRYRDYGTMATVGRKVAIVEMGRLKTAGFFAWLIWLFVHLMQLVGFENRLLVLSQWAWSYTTRGRSARLITGRSHLDGRYNESAQHSIRQFDG